MDISKILERVYTAKPELRKRTISDIEGKDIFLAESLIQEEYAEAKEAIFEGNKVEFIDAIVDSMWMVLNYAALAGVTITELDTYASLVLTSNYSKFCESEEEAAQTVALYSIGQHPDKMLQSIKTYYKKVGDVYVVLREDDNKIMKSYKYEDVKLLHNQYLKK